MQWDIAYMQLEKAETTFEAAGLLERPEHSLRCCGCTGNSCCVLSFVPVSSFSAASAAQERSPQAVCIVALTHVSDVRGGGEFTSAAVQLGFTDMPGLSEFWSRTSSKVYVWICVIALPVTMGLRSEMMLNYGRYIMQLSTHIVKFSGQDLHCS